MKLTKAILKKILKEVDKILLLNEYKKFENDGEVIYKKINEHAVKHTLELRKEQFYIVMIHNKFESIGSYDSYNAWASNVEEGIKHINELILIAKQYKDSDFGDKQNNKEL